MVTVSRLRQAPLDELPAAGRRAAARGATLGQLADAAARCRGCELWRDATQVVFGAGPVPADVMLVGEQPGDREDLEGRPFVGPAGRLLDAAMAEAGLDRERAFVTNVVKHFKWRPAAGTKRRLHERPNRTEVGACLPWVEAELALVQPQALLLLGATAAHGLLGGSVSVLRDRGRAIDSDLAPLVVVTIHPAAILRAGPGRDAARQSFVTDLRFVAEQLAAGHRRAARSA